MTSDRTSTDLSIKEPAPPNWTARGLARAPGLQTVAIAVIFALLSFLYMGPAITNCESTIMGGPGDATAGGVWLGWQYQQLDVGPWPADTPYLNAPYGESIWGPYLITAVGLFGPLWALNQITGPVCAWNLIIFTGFLATALAMFGFVRWLTGSSFAAFFAGFAYGFSPFHMYKAQGHMAYLHSELLVILLWAWFALWRRPSWKTALMLGGTFALVAYTDGYYILIGSVISVAFVIGALFHTALVRSEAGVLKKRLKYMMASGIAALLLVLPIVAVFLTSKDQIGLSLPRSKGELVTYSARWHEYVLPARSHPYFSRFFGNFQDSHLHESNYSEQTLFVGWTVLLLASGLAVVSLKRKPQPGTTREGVSLRFASITLGAVLFAALAFSAPPKFDLAGLDFAGPSSVIFKYLKLWRVYARFFLAVHAAAVALAALGLAYILRNKRTAARAAITLILTSILAFEFLTFPPRAVWSYSEAPPEYEWLRGQNDITTIAEYPLAVPPANEAYAYKSFQPIHGKRLFNSNYANGRQQPLRVGLYGLEDPQTIPVLRRLGIQAAVIHMDYFPGIFNPGTEPPGLRLVKTVTNKTRIYSIEPGPIADLSLAVEKGFYPPEPRNWTSFHWMTSKGRLRVVRLFGEHRSAVIRFRAESFSVPRSLTAKQNGKVLWQGQITDTLVEFSADVSKPILLTSEPGGIRGPGTDDRRLAIGISELDVKPRI